MTAPRVEIDLAALAHNTRVLAERLGGRGIGVTGVTKLVRGRPEVARALVGAGVRRLGDSRVENIRAMRRAGVRAEMTLIRSPMLSQIDQVVAHADSSFNTELDVVAALSSAAGRRGLVHGIVAMVELGDLREGLMPEDLEPFVEAVLLLPNLRFAGIGANLACRSGVVPDDGNMRELTAMVCAVESRFDLTVETVSGGNSATVAWALGAADVGRVNDLRLGESILLGREPSSRHPIEGLRTDAFTVVAEVIESKVKPAAPWGRIAQTAFGTVPRSPRATGLGVQTILAIGEQDVDPAGLVGPEGVEVLGASSDHLVVATPEVLTIGSRMRFEPTYAAVLRAITSPFLATELVDAVGGAPVTRSDRAIARG